MAGKGGSAITPPDGVAPPPRTRSTTDDDKRLMPPESFWTYTSLRIGRASLDRFDWRRTLTRTIRMDK